MYTNKTFEYNFPGSMTDGGRLITWEHTPKNNPIQKIKK